MYLKEKVRKEILSTTVRKHLDRMTKDYPFWELADRGEEKAAILIMHLTYQELKFDLFLQYLLVRPKEVLGLFDDYFRGSYKELYEELIKYDLELLSLAPKEEGEPMDEDIKEQEMDPLRRIVVQQLEDLKPVYIQLLNVPNQFLPALKKAFENIVNTLEEEGVPTTLDQLLQVLKEELPKLHMVYFKPLRQYRDRLKAIAPKAKIEPRGSEEEPKVLTPPSRPISPGATESSGELLNDAWGQLLTHWALSPMEFYEKVKGILQGWKAKPHKELSAFHKLIFSLYKKSQDYLEGFQKGREMLDSDLMRAKYLNCALGIAYAESAERGIKGIKGILKVQ